MTKQERREELRRRLRARDVTLEQDLSFIGLSGLLTGAIVGSLIMLGAQLAFADTWVEESASGVIVHDEGESYGYDTLERINEINAELGDWISQRHDERVKEQEIELLKPSSELEQLKHDLWLKSKSFWDKLLM
jgi:hypothetical protein